MQRVAIDEEEAPSQGRFGSDPKRSATAQRSEAAEPTPHRTGLPDALKQGIEALSGLSMDGVRVHYGSSRPAQLQAHAFAQGRDIHVAPGQERHLPHEAWHVVQQAQGRVRPTMQWMGGVLVNDDPWLELEADVMGRRALHGPAKQIAQRQAMAAHRQNNKATQFMKPPLIEGSLRPALGKKLMVNLFGPNWFATSVFKTMNFLMYIEGHRLTREHNAVLEDALIKNKNGVLATLIAENPHVMKSSGRTPIYLMGKYLVHFPLETCLRRWGRLR